MMTWFDMFPQFRLPSGGNFVQPIAPVTSWFSPTIEVNYKGDPAIERDVVTTVAGYGSQLGTLLDALVEIAGDAKGPAMQKLRALKDQIEAVKDKHRDVDAARARAALAALEKSDPAARRAVIEEFGRKK